MRFHDVVNFSGAPQSKAHMRLPIGETISVKFYLNVNGWPTYTEWRRNIAENFRTTRTLQTDRRQTDDRRTGEDINSERECEFTFANKNAVLTQANYKPCFLIRLRHF